MEQTSAYLLIILFPVIPWFLKLTLSYNIRFKTPGFNVEKYYKKRTIPFIRKFFYVDVRQHIKPTLLYYANILAGCILLLSILVSLIYFILALFKHTLTVSFIPDFVMYSSLVLSIILVITGIMDNTFLDNINNKRRKK